MTLDLVVFGSVIGLFLAYNAYQHRQDMKKAQEMSLRMLSHLDGLTLDRDTKQNSTPKKGDS